VAKETEAEVEEEEDEFADSPELYPSPRVKRRKS
jgi:hypothetical protein